MLLIHSSIVQQILFVTIFHINCNMSNIKNNLPPLTYLVVAVIAGGLFTSVLFFNGQSNPAFAQTNSNLVVHIKSGNPENKDDVHAAKMGLTLANHFQDTGRNVTVFLDVNGANLAANTPKSGLNETTPLLKQFIGNKGSVYVCSECLTDAGYSPTDVLSGVVAVNQTDGTMLKVLNNNAIVIDY